MITVRMACGHDRLEMGDDVKGVPICPVCGERRVQQTTAPPPRFRGVCTGPSARLLALEPMAVAGAAPEGPLPMPKRDA